MIPGLSEREFRELLLSVGTHKGNRPLTPVEVGERFSKAITAGASTHECATAMMLKGDTMVKRFLSLTKLPPDLKHLIDWRESGVGVVGFSGAVELLRCPADTQAELGLAIIEHGLTKKEVQSVRQLFERSGDGLSLCVGRVVGRRPVVRHMEVVLGAVVAPDLRASLLNRSQYERNRLLAPIVAELTAGFQGVVGRLGTSSYSLVGPKGLIGSLSGVGDHEHAVERALRLTLASGPRDEQEDTNDA